MDDETKRLIASLPLSSYRKQIIANTECVDKNQMLKIILDILSDNSQLFEISETVVLFLLFKFEFKGTRLQEKFFDDENFLRKNGFAESLQRYYAPKDKTFPDDYHRLRLTTIDDLVVDEEKLNNLTAAGFNRVVAICALAKAKGDVSEALKLCRSRELKRALEGDFKRYRGLIAPTYDVASKAPLLVFSPELFYDLCCSLETHAQVVEAVTNPKKTPASFRNWIASLTERYEKARVVAGDAFTCDVCYEDWPAADRVVNRCGHAFCRSCMVSHIHALMWESGKNVGKAPCLASGCPCGITMDLVRALVDDYTYYRYCELVISAFVEQNHEVILKYCPGSNCQKLLHYKSVYFGGGISAICDCQTSVCLLCGETNHRPATCQMWKAWSEIMKKDGLNMKWIRENSRPCPTCGAFIEKNGGCQWMVCHKCHGYFCWVCMQATNDHQHKAGQVCKAYKQETISADYIDDQLLSYITHYDLQNVGVTQAMDRYKTIIDIINRRKNISYILAPLYEASLVEIDAHMILRNLYIYINARPEAKDLIEYQQKQFQMQAEILTKRIQTILKAEIIDHDMMSALAILVKPIKESFEKITKAIEEELEQDN